MAGSNDRTASSRQVSSQHRHESEPSGQIHGAGRMPWQRGRQGRDRELGPTRIKAPQAIAEDPVTRSIRTVERAVENFAALQENCEYFKGLAIEMRKAFDNEKEHARSYAQKLVEAERAIKADRERADRAEQRLEASAQTIEEMVRQLAVVRAQTDRLVQTISRLMSVESKVRGSEMSLADLLAA